MDGPGTWTPCGSQATVPLRPIPELEDYLFEDTSVNSSLPYIPRATTQRQQRDRKAFLGAHGILDQVGKSPCSWSQKLVSTCGQPATWSTPAQCVGGATVPGKASPHAWLRGGLPSWAAWFPAQHV